MSDLFVHQTGILRLQIKCSLELKSDRLLAAAYVAAAGSVTLTSVEGLKVGSIFTVGETVFKATVIDTGTKVVTVSVLSGDANQADASEVVFLGNARAQGSDRQDSDLATPIERYNRTQIFDDSVIISGTQEAVSQYGGGSLDLTLEKAVKKKLERLYLMLGRAIWNNPRIAPSDNNSEPLMGGINYFIGQNGQTTSGAFSHANISAFAYELYQAGLISPEIWINPKEADKFRALDNAYIQIDAKVSFAGRPLPTLLYTTFGQEIPIKIDPQCPEGQHFIMDSSLLSVHPLSGRQFFVKKASDDDDNKKARIIGEYTLKMLNSAFAGRYTPTA